MTPHTLHAFPNFSFFSSPLLLFDLAMASHAILLIRSLIALGFLAVVLAGNFYSDVSPVYGDWRVQIFDGGQLLTLSMDNYTGSGFKSNNSYFYGKFDMLMKLIPNNSAGTVTTFYFTSQGFSQSDQNEIDLEFLGNSSGEPYTLHTNIYVKGNGSREQQFKLWFDPTQDFHTYSVLWNSQIIVIYVDGTPIRQHKNLQAQMVPFPNDKPMYIYSTLWSADWATQGGRVKTDWSEAPFTASFRNFSADACLWSAAGCDNSWLNQTVLDVADEGKINWVQNNFMIYNYCTDKQRFPGGLPPECSV